MSNYDIDSGFVIPTDITGLLYYKQPYWITISLGSFIIDEQQFLSDWATDAGDLATEALDEDNEKGFLQMCEFESWVKELKSARPILPTDSESLAKRLLRKAQIHEWPQPADFALILDNNPALYITQTFAYLNRQCGNIRGVVLPKRVINRLCGEYAHRKTHAVAVE